MPPGDMDTAIQELAIACRKGNLDRVKHLLAWGVDPNTEVEGEALLIRAARGGHYMVVKQFIKAGATPTMPALVAAVSSGNRYAVDHIADELHFNDVNITAYPWLNVLGRREFLEALTPEMATWLVTHGIDFEETDSFGRSITELADKYADPEVAQILLDG